MTRWASFTWRVEPATLNAVHSNLDGWKDWKSDWKESTNGNRMRWGRQSNHNPYCFHYRSMSNTFGMEVPLKETRSLSRDEPVKPESGSHTHLTPAAIAQANSKAWDIGSIMWRLPDILQPGDGVIWVFCRWSRHGLKIQCLGIYPEPILFKMYLNLHCLLQSNF